MKIFLDSAEVEKIRRFAAIGMVDGITTNPTLILKSGRKQKEVVKEICKIVPGPVSVEGVQETAEGMVEDGEEFASWAKNVVVKIPMTEEGLKAVRILSKKKIKTNVTLVFSPSQALLVAKAGATFVSPFVGRLDDIGQDGMGLVRQILQIYRNYGFGTQVIVASVRSEKHVVQAAEAGAHIATVPPQVLESMFRHQLTDAGIKKFKEDWEASQR
ncbi:MAG: fructose-6-phosphate aldolase [Candidatus Micrarchaeota archaeon]|nr:fructose-6-phosphate aldolase [Candidatus Micrarchaeota archaeon]